MLNIQVSLKSKYFPLEANIAYIGADLLITIMGGESHVGAVAIAQPRPSLADKNKLSATTSVFCCLGHKDDEIAKPIADMLAAKLKKNVVVVAGMHWDSINAVDVNTIRCHVEKLSKKILERLL